MKKVLALLVLIFLFVIHSTGQKETKITINAYYTRLPFDDHGFTGKFADIVVEIPAKGKFIFSREYSYQPYWQPTTGKLFHVDRLIPRVGDGPAERPDKNNICSNVAIIAQTATSVTVHWRYAPDITKGSFTNFTEAYNKAGNASEFYADYADEYFTINTDGTVLREAKNGCYSLDDWNDPQNQFTQKLSLTPKGITQKSLTQPKTENLAGQGIPGEVIKTAPAFEAIANFRFDEGMSKAGKETTESLSNTSCSIIGTKAYWRKGVSGTCLSFDSYSNAVVLPSQKVQPLSNELSVEAWIAPQEYPFNLAAIVDHLNGSSGYFLGMTARGEVEFKIGNGTVLTNVTSLPVPLYQWTHVLATFKKSNRMCIYLNGQLAVATPAPTSFADATDTEISVGMTRSQRQFPLGAERDVTRGFQTNFVFSGLIDEVSVFKKSMTDYNVKLRYAALAPTDKQPLQAWILPYGPEKTDGFGAMLTSLKYSPEWDGIWRVGKYSDLIVGFDDLPWRFVFWRGTRYLPSLVTDKGNKGIWSNDQSPEQYIDQCFEHMSDMQCRFSNIRLISSNAARVIVHWRNSSTSIGYNWVSLDENGWAVWTDEYWTIYPDGVSVRHQISHNSSKVRIHEMNQNEILLHPGQTPEDAVNDNGVILANEKGESQTWFRSKPEPDNALKGNKNLQYINLKSETKQFQIGEVGSKVDQELNKDIYWLGWNHYPTQLIPSDGTIALQYDRPTSSCMATFRELRHALSPVHTEAMTIFGLTNGKPSDLTNLNRSWNFAPAIADEIGCSNAIYVKSEKAYYLTKNADLIQFNILASNESPLVNPAFIIRNWNKPLDKVEVKINGQVITDNKALKKGIEIDTDGKPMLVIWMKLVSENVSIFRINTL
ncbi:MAG: LamG domain-containing protein [Salinivirgaceae bacterium]|jgi:hypothetical protein|nr:LamG domain-containing protein [Salinivirgaceae bacterium]